MYCGEKYEISDLACVKMIMCKDKFAIAYWLPLSVEPVLF